MSVMNSENDKNAQMFRNKEYLCEIEGCELIRFYGNNRKTKLCRHHYYGSQTQHIPFTRSQSRGKMTATDIMTITVDDDESEYEENRPNENGGNTSDSQQHPLKMSIFQVKGKDMRSHLKAMIVL
jgi:hypothetical protein